MERIGKPRGLVDYMALADNLGQGTQKSYGALLRHVLRPRVLLYAGLWSGIGAALVFALFLRPDLEFSVAPVRNPTFVVLSDGSIRNSYDFRIRNRHGEDATFSISSASEHEFSLATGMRNEPRVFIPADRTGIHRIHVTAPAASEAAAEASTEFRFWVEDLTSGERAFADTVFNGSGR